MKKQIICGDCTSEVEAEPVCSQDVCHWCKQCLACYGQEACDKSPTGEHEWLVFDNAVPDTAKQLATEHWDYLETLCRKVFTDGFVHGYKHGVESERSIQ